MNSSLLKALVLCMSIVVSKNIGAQTCDTDPVKLQFSKAGITSFSAETSHATIDQMTNSDSKWPVVYISMANFDTKPGFFGLESGDENGEIVMNITFNGNLVGWDDELPEITTGSYTMKSDMEGSVDVSFNRGGKTVQGIFRSAANVVGSGEILEIGADYVCFRLNLKDKVTGDFVSMSDKVMLKKN